MLRHTSVVSISLPPEILAILEQITRQTSKTRSEVIRDLLVSYSQDKSWEQIFTWGRKTKEKFNIKNEEDIVKLIND
jgi:metal-responsive CopG/Arc/MetJ family transcriptional regulator